MVVKEFTDDFETAVYSNETKRKVTSPFISHTPKIRFNSITNSIDIQSEYTKDLEVKKSKEFVEQQLSSRQVQLLEIISGSDIKIDEK